MDWNYLVKDFFKLSESEREVYIKELIKFYYERWIATDNPEIFNFTINELINRLYLEQKYSEKREEYERAEIFYKLVLAFQIIQEEKEFN